MCITDKHKTKLGFHSNSALPLEYQAIIRGLEADMAAQLKHVREMQTNEPIFK